MHPVLRNLLWQFIYYTVEEGGTFHSPRRGISRSSSLSPLLAAFHLTQADRCFVRQARVVQYLTRWQRWPTAGGPPPAARYFPGARPRDMPEWRPGDERIGISRRIFLTHIPAPPATVVVPQILPDIHIDINRCVSDKVFDQDRRDALAHGNLLSFPG